MSVARAHRRAVIASLAVGAACGGARTVASQSAPSGEHAVARSDGPTARADAGTSAVADGSSSSSETAGAAAFTAPTGPRAQQAMQRFVEGNAAFSRGDFAAAASSFRAAYDLAPSPAMAFNLARVYERMGEVEQGVHYFEIVLASNPDATMRADIEHRIASLRAYEQRRHDGIAQPPPSTDELSAEGANWFRRGITLFRRRQFQPALLAFQQAYQYLQTPELLFNLAAAHERLGHLDQAIEFLREYLQQRRDTPEEAEIQRHITELQDRQ
jgi:tetratricopeptide (TPR) repeat protein